MYINEIGLAKTSDMLKAYVDNKIQNVGEPVEISTALEMNSLLTAENVGKVYKFTGTTDANYTNGDLYEVEEVI